jgi:lantibiotic biosynthesis protein
LPHLAHQLTRAARSEDIGFLEGDAGVALALGTATRDAPPVSGWDACLLID